MTDYELTFQDLQQDIEGYLRAAGGVEKRPDGLTWFHGYDDALDRMWQQYLARRAYDPLIAHLRSRNHEVGDGRFLLELSEALHRDGEWRRLRLLWMRVYKKRGRLYNEMRRINRKSPGEIPGDQVEHLKGLIITALERLQAFAEESGKADDAYLFAGLRARVEKGLNAQVSPADL